MSSKLILICGPSGSGKTTLAKAIADKVDGVAINLDRVLIGSRGLLTAIHEAANVARDIGEDTGKLVISDCLFFKEEQRKALGADYTFVLGGRITKGFEYSNVYIVQSFALEDRVEEVLSVLGYVAKT
jgi:energy-coupling factor transporter ATP-binding protein EcfA2